MFQFVKHFLVLVDHKDGVDLFERLQVSTSFQPVEFHDKLKRLEDAILDLRISMNTFGGSCRSTADELTKRRSKVNTTVMAGSGAGVVGGILSIVGVALSPTTFGGSLALTIVGGILGAGGGICSGTARAIEGIKQNRSTECIKEAQNTIATRENQLVAALQDVSAIISVNLNRHFDASVDGPGMNRRGFFALGSAVRFVHGGTAVGLAAAKVGASGVVVGSLVMAPLSIILDSVLLIDAFSNVRKKHKTGASEILEVNAKMVEMKMTFLMCMLRGNIDDSTRIV